jgi:hypothetical protein
MAHSACLVCLISTVSGRSKKGPKWGANSGHTTKLEQSRFSLDIYGGTCYHENIMFSVSLLQFRHPDCDRECWIIVSSLENTNPDFREYQP